jgi:hypothetical protein
MEKSSCSRQIQRGAPSHDDRQISNLRNWQRQLQRRRQGLAQHVAGSCEMTKRNSNNASLGGSKSLPSNVLLGLPAECLSNKQAGALQLSGVQRSPLPRSFETWSSIPKAPLPPWPGHWGLSSAARHLESTRREQSPQPMLTATQEAHAVLCALRWEGQTPSPPSMAQAPKALQMALYLRPSIRKERSLDGIRMEQTSTRFTAS